MTSSGVGSAGSSAEAAGDGGASGIHIVLARQQLTSAIRGAHERRRRNLEAQSGGATRVLTELLGRDVAGHGQAAALRLQVLADGDQVDRGGGAIGEYRGNLVGGLAEADHEAALDQRA